MTHYGLSAWVQHSCCEIAESHLDCRVRCKNLGLDQIPRRWQLVAQDLFGSIFRGGPGAAFVERQPIALPFGGLLVG